MKRVLLIMLAMSMVIAACGCSGNGAQSGITPVEDITTLPVDASPLPAYEEPQDIAPAAQSSTDVPSCTLVTTKVLYPEGATEADAEYALEYTIPVFTGDNAVVVGMNEAVSMLEDEILTRVNDERIPFADRAEGAEAPSTVITCTVEAHRGFIDAVFNEAITYGGEVETSLFTLVLDESGEEASLASASGIFAPEEIVAQQVWNIIDSGASETTYYGDISPETLSSALDLYSGFVVTDTGYTVYAAPGTLADESMGVLEFSFDKSALYPDFVGDSMTIEEYETSVSAINALAAACAPYYESFADGSPSAFVTTAFLSRMIVNSADKTQSGSVYIEVSRDAYDAMFKDYFPGNMPADLTSMGDGTIFSENTCGIPALPQAAYSLRIDECTRENDIITLFGMLMCGRPGTMNATELTPATIVMHSAPDSPAKFQFDSLTLA